MFSFNVFSPKKILMTENIQRKTRAFFAISMLVLATLIVSHYWSTNSFNDIKHVPTSIMIFAFAYIVLHMLKRMILKTQNWWDLIYYAGLLAMVIPVLWGTVENEKLYHQIADFGTLFLIIPILIDGWVNMKNKPTQTN